MKQTTKLLLDIVMGAVVPIAILNYLTEPLGATMAYVVAALVPVGWVFADLLFITKRFNFITSYIGLSAIIRGLLAFWFVDGAQFALKDSASFVIAVVVFGGSVLLRQPITKYFFLQALNPETPEQETALGELLVEKPVRRSLVTSSLLIALINLIGGVANFLLNLSIVIAEFGTTAFNLQVARVNAITRIALAVPEALAFAGVMWLIYRALYQQLPSEEGKSQLESDFWDLMRMREELQARG